MSKRIALVEPNNYHAEVLPPLAYLLKSIGFEVTVFMTSFIRSQDPFVNLPALGIEQRIIGDSLTEDLQFADAIVWSSIEPERNLPLVQSIDKPALAVVHKGERVTSSPYKQLFEEKELKVISLSRHFSEFLNTRGLGNTHLFPCYFNEGVSSDGNLHEAPVFCVQGKVEFKRRNYASMLDAAATLHKNYPDEEFGVKLLGKNNSIEGNLLRLRVLLNRARKRIKIPGVQPEYREFYQHLMDSDFICPLIDTSTPRYSSYFRDTSSSAIPLGLGHDLIPVLHKDLAELYGLSNQSILYENGDLAGAMRKAMLLSNDEKTELLDKVRSYREAALQRSAERLDRLMTDLLYG